MKKFVLTLLISTFFCNITFAENLSFIHITDVHTPKSDVRTYEGRSFEYAETNFKTAINQINKTNTNYVFFTGDSVDQAFEEVFDKFFSYTNDLNKPYFIALGNHDVNTPNGFTKAETLIYLKNKTRYKQDNANYYVELNDKFLAVMLDGTNDTKIDSRGHFKKKTLKWFEGIINQHPDKYILVFQHFPIVEPAKDNSYFHKHTTKHKRPYIKLLKKYPSIILVSSGHYHVTGEFEKYGCKHFSTPALFLKDAYYRIVNIDYDNNKINSIKTELIKL